MKVRRIPFIGLQIRSIHPYGFRSGEWGFIVGVVSVTPLDLSERLCWHVGFDNGEYDHWPVNEQYEFRESP